MSESALSDYENARERQLSRNDARRIRTRVTEARSKEVDAGGRWPFELLQNAHDAGPRPGRTGIKVRLATTQDGFIFEHDGAVFQPQDLAALLSGGSSKDFEGEDTTGRFGTGFLVTHVLSERTEVLGILATKKGHEWFSVSLDRGGNEEQILANIDAAKLAIRAAEVLKNIDDTPSARFVYRTENQAQLQHGLDTFRTALPYLFATCPKLDEVVLEAGEKAERWLASTIGLQASEKFVHRQRSIQRHSSEGTRTFVTHVLTTEAQPNASAIFATETVGETSHLVRLPAQFPRVFRRFPVRATTFLRTEAVLEGHFDVDQERREVLLNERGGALVEVALDCLVRAASVAHELGIEGGHWLARVGPVAEGALAENERAWWTERLKTRAEAIGRLPLVDTQRGAGSAIGNGDWYVDFIGAPELSHSGEAAADALWDLAARCERLDLPEKELSRDWSQITQEWKALGVETLHIFGLTDLRMWAFDDAPKATAAVPFEHLLVTGDRLEWLARLYELAGQVPKDKFRPEWLDHLLLNQRDQLVAHASLTRDLGVLEGTKQAAEKIKIGLRTVLFNREVINLARELELKHVEPLLDAVVTPTMTEEAALERCLTALDQAVQPKKNPTAEYVVEAGTALLAHLWVSRKTEAGDLARRVPLATTKPNEYFRWNRANPIMAPVSTWPETARPFDICFPPQRVMHVDYDRAEAFPHALEGLQAWGIAYTDPLTEGTVSELRERRLAPLLQGEVDPDGLIVRDQKCSSIALLSPEVINHCTELEQVKALLGLVLTDIVVRDEQWRTFRSVTAHASGREVSIELRPALWVGELLSRAWVPAMDQRGERARFEPTPEVLRPLIDREWLKDNPRALEFLADVLGFDRLDLRLFGCPEEEAKRIRDILAELIDQTQHDPDALERVLDVAEVQRKGEQRVAAARALGFAVQEAVREALEDRGLALELVDRGFDYEARLGEELLEDASSRIGIGRLLIEIKATTSGEVKLTPTQAETASQTSNYVLCVVDLRGADVDPLAATWTPADVALHSRFLNTISESVAPTWKHVERARAEDVPIRNEDALRFGVAADLWESGLTLSQWCDWAIETLRAKEPA